MKLLRRLLPLLGIVAASPAFAQQAPYVDPALRTLLRPAVEQAIRSAPVVAPGVAEPAPGTSIVVRRNSIVDVPRVAMFVRIRSNAGRAALESAGARIGSQAGDILTAEVPIDRLDEVFRSPEVEMFEASHRITISNDSSMRVTRADLVRRAGPNGWTGTAGRNVIVGIYDTGIDFTHDDFLDPAGQTRVLALWDQTGRTGTPPAGFTYGRFCSRADIQQAIANPALPACPQLDLAGHGTHVAGSAAGDGSATGMGGTPFEFAGVAPLADLMVVKGGDGIFSESGIIDGLVWLEREARALNRPMVVNLSLGGQGGPHDGSRLYELAVDNLSRPGFIIVFSGGNNGFNANDRNPDGSEPARDATYFHGTGVLAAAREFTIDVAPYTPDSGTCNDFVNISLWYEAGDALEVTVRRPDGSAVTAPFRQLREQDNALGNVRIDNGSAGPNPRNAAYEADIRINDCASGAAPVAGIWTLRITPVTSTSGRPYHFWIQDQALGGRAWARGRQGFDNHFIISSPGNARSAITVGAFASRLCWDSPAKPEGPVCFTTREQLGDIARFSSAGPTRDGRQKPEITAPGLAVVSAKSSAAAPPPNRIMSDGVHWATQGTSMAAPQVAGTIALLLEGRPTLTHADVRTILANGSTQDEFTTRSYDTGFGAQPRFWWGFGKLNVCGALSVSGAGGASTGPVVITPSADTIPINATTRFFSCSPSGAAIAFHSTNPAVASVDATGSVRALQLGTARVVATSGGFADTAVVVVTDPASLHVTLRDAAPAAATLAPRGTRLPLLVTALRANGYEPIRVTQLSYRLSGRDASAQLLLVADADRDGQADAGEPVIATRAVALAGAPVQVDLTVDSLIAPQRDSVQVLALLELSGAAPNGGSFTAEFVPGGTRATGMRSLTANRIEAVTSPLASSPAATTVLAASELFALSENPVRSERVVFSFRESPSVAAIYTLAGRLVADLGNRLVVPGSVEWNLTNDEGARVAAGAYLAVFRFGAQTVREKIFVLGRGRP